MGYASRWNSTDQIPLRAADAGRIDRFGAVDPTDGGRSSRYSLSTQWAKSDAGKSTRASAYVIYSKLRLFSNFTYFLNDPGNGDQFGQVDRRPTAGAEASQPVRPPFAGPQVETT